MKFICTEAKLCIGISRTVFSVSRKRCPRMSHLYADLMVPSSLQMNLHQGLPIFAVQYMIRKLRPLGFPFFRSRHPGEVCPPFFLQVIHQDPLCLSGNARFPLVKDIVG